MKKCPFCAEMVQVHAIKCRYCHESLFGAKAKWQRFGERYRQMSEADQARQWNKLSVSQQKIASGVLEGRPVSEAMGSRGGKSNWGAFFLGLLFGPVGLWYKGQRAAGFAWIVTIFIIVIGIGGFAILVAPVFWIGMAVHGALAEPTE